MKIGFFCFTHIIVLVLLSFFLVPALSPVLEWVDREAFLFLNGSLNWNSWTPTFWACLNHRYADWVEDGIFLIFLILGMKITPKEMKLLRWAQFIFLVSMIVGITLLREFFFRNCYRVDRLSPSLVVQPCVRLSHLLKGKGISVKDRAYSSFPGDHAITLILFAFFYSFFLGRRLGKYAWGYAIFRSLPRLVVGAHWFSDVAIGSLSISLLFVSWILSTPFHLFAIKKIEKGLLVLQKGKRTEA